MAQYYTVEELKDGVLLSDTLGLVNKFQFSFSSGSGYLTSPNATNGTGSGYFTFETAVNSEGNYSGSINYGMGSRTININSNIILKPTGSAYESGYIWSAIIKHGVNDVENTISFTPDWGVPPGSVYLRGTGGISLAII
jgi:hypothetical protein